MKFVIVDTDGSDTEANVERSAQKDLPRGGLPSSSQEFPRIYHQDAIT
jgi:hypothetical protein